jgi:hypothetical protein
MKPYFRNSRLLGGVLLALASLGQPVFGWNSFGHMVVASVAYRNLDSQTQAKVATLLALNPSFKTWSSKIPGGTAKDDRARMIFMLAATWPDAIKSDSKYHDDGDDGGNRPTGPNAAQNTGYDDFNRHKYWHFVDTPFSQDGTDVSSLKIPTPDAETQIAAFRTVLKSATASTNLKSYDLVWLLHLIGDVHQPLHSATRVSAADPQGDNGGNNVKFCAASAATCSGELHAFWDDILGTSSAVASADTFAAGLDAASTSSSDVADAQTWITASFKLAQSQVYIEPVGVSDGPFKATDTYTGAARTLAKSQVALAGARLAEVLKEDLQIPTKVTKAKKPHADISQLKKPK